MNNLQNNRMAMQRWNNASGRQPVYRRATGNGMLANTPSSQPVAGPFQAQGGTPSGLGAPSYILNISNISAAIVNNFDIFGANSYLSGNYGGGTWSSSGNFTLNGITISSVWGTVSYQQILAATANKPFTSGGVYVQNVSGSSAQAMTTYNITTVDSAGNSYSQPVAPTVDPYQQQLSITYNTIQFNIDGMTKLTFSSVGASTTFQVRIYPSNVIDPSQALNGGAVQTNFTSPNVIGNLNPVGRRY